MKSTLFIAAILMFCSGLSAEVVTETVEYELEGVLLEGYLAYNDASDAVRPGVMVVHDWTGLNDYTRSRCRQLAEMGYIAFAADIYGKGVRPKNGQESAEQAGRYRADRALLRARANAGMDILRDHQLSDDSRLAAIGYCFGGGTVLELARSGAALAGVVSFHGNLDTPDPSVAANIKCKILVCHGAVDPFVSAEVVQAFQEEMEAASVDYQFIAYSGAVHAFTKPGAGDDPSAGVAYNADADRRSWEHMKLFFAEIFK